MSQASLISGGNARDRWQKIQQLSRQIKPDHDLANDPDFHLLESETSLKIEEVRELERTLALKPFKSAPKIAVLKEADKLTFEAQGALLKILEEPPGETFFFLATRDLLNLLPTIVSRCQVIYLPAKTELELSPEDYSAIKTATLALMKKGFGARLPLAEKMVTKGEALLFCRQQLVLWQGILREKPTLPRAKIIRNIQKTLVYLQANVSPRLAIEALLLAYPQLPS